MDTIKSEHIEGRTVLIIEDNDGDFFLIEDYLLEKFKEVTLFQAGSLATAKDFLANNSPDVAVILLDLHLPDANGVQLVKTIVDLANDVPIVILSGYSNIKTAQESLKLGVSDYLLKDDLSPEILYRALVYAKERNSYVNLLQRSTKMYQELFDFSPQPMWVFDPKDLSFLNVNKAAELKYGYGKEELLNMTLRDIRPKDHWEALDQSQRSRKTEPGNPYAGVFTHSLKSGERIQVEIYSNDIDFEGIDARLVLANDVTEKYNYIQTIETQNERLREIAWTQSHVVRAPLSRILGIIHLLEMEGECSEELKFLLEQIQVSGREMDAIIQDIVAKTAEIDWKNE